jgi:ATP/maltotriose-dependent transcriptional regulator MalT
VQSAGSPELREDEDKAASGNPEAPMGDDARQMALVGRTNELARIDSALDQVEQGESRLLAVSGEAGVGKTRILSEVASRATSRGHTVLSGRGTELEGEVSFAVFVEALDDLLASLGTQALEALRNRLPHLADVFPAVERPPWAQVGPATERFRHHRDIRTLVEGLAGERPLTLLIDDLHWADRASVETIAHLVRQPPASRVLLVLANRSGQAPPILQGPVAAAEREGRAEHLALNPLNEEAAALLLAAEGDAERRQQIFVESGGNPFYIEQLLRAARTGDVPAVAGSVRNGGMQIPAVVMATLEEELRHLSDSLRQMLQGAAVVGEPFEPELAAEAVGLSVYEALDLLDELVALDWVRADVTPRLFHFRHPIVRRAVYDSIPPGRLTATHRRAAEILANMGAPAGARAHHVALSARRADEAAIATLSTAAFDAATTAPNSAAEWFGAALSLLPADQVGRRFGLLVPLAQAQAAGGSMEAACETLAEITTVLPPEAGVLWTQAVATLASLELYLGRRRGAGRRLEAALKAIPEGSNDATRLLVVLAVDAVYRGDRSAATLWGGRALEKSVASTDPSMRAAALSAQTLSLEMAGNIDAARHCGTEAATEVDALTDNELAPGLETLAYLGAAETFLERFDDGVRHLERGVAIALSCGNVQCVMPTRTFASYGLWRLGRVDEALQMAADAVETGRLLRMPAATAWALAIAALAWSAVDGAQAMRLGEEALALLGEVDDDITSYGSHALVAGVCSAVGDHERCLGEAQLAGAPDFEHLEPGVNCHLAEAVTRSLLSLQRFDDACSWAERGEAFAADLGLGVAAAATLRARALVLLASSEPELASKHALEAVERGVESHAPIELARSRIVAGQAFAAAGDRPRAVREFRDARVELARCGARRFEHEAARGLRALGVAAPAPVARRAGDYGTKSLSKREREIANLVTAGKSNPEIAETLFLSPKTVEGHMRRIFAKLDVSSRAQVAAAIVRAQDAPG